MIAEISRKDGKILETLLGDAEKPLIRSYLQNHMGHGWADDLRHPTCAQILVGDFCFFSGNHESPDAATLVQNLPSSDVPRDLLMVPQNEAWAQLIESSHQGRLHQITRYAFHKERDGFCREKLRALLHPLPSGFRVVPIDQHLYQEALRHDFSRDFCSQFASAEDFARRGLGFCALHDGEMVSGASSYVVYDDGIEIQVETRKEYRHKGLAAACAAALILACLNQDLYPCWDAHNQASLSLAEKLGYRPSHEYAAYEIALPGDS